MAEDSDAEKTEEPTTKRQTDARERGQVARSRELGTAAVMITGSAALVLGGGTFAGSFARLMHGGLVLDRGTLSDPDAMGRQLGLASVDALLVILPFLAAVIAAAVLAPLVLGGWVFSGQALVPDFGRLNPASGLGRIFGITGFAELVKALLKFSVVGVIAFAVGMWLVSDTVALGAMPTEPGIGHAVHLLALGLLLMSCGLAVVAAVDAPFQWWFHRRKLKMTREEVREESKETDGRPEVKTKIREMQRKLSKRRMMQDVPRADVVVTNPTHYAVALKYEAGKMRAPRVLAKGRDLIALEIRRIATGAGVPIFEAPVLARVLHGAAEVGREIPTGLYLAVAQVLSYVFQVRTLTPTRAARLKRPTPEVDPALRAKYDSAEAAR